MPAPKTRRRASQKPVTAAPESYPVSSPTCFPFTPWLWNPKDQYSVSAFESYCRSLRSTLQNYPEHLETRTFEMECLILLLHHAFNPANPTSRPPFFMMAQQILGPCLKAAHQQPQRQNNRQAIRLWEACQELIPERAKQCSEASKRENAQKRVEVWDLLETQLGRKETAGEMGPNHQQGPNAMTAEQRAFEPQKMEIDPGRWLPVQKSGRGNITDSTLPPTNGQAHPRRAQGFNYQIPSNDGWNTGYPNHQARPVMLANQGRRSAPHPNPQAYPGASSLPPNYQAMLANGGTTAQDPPYLPQVYVGTLPPMPDYAYPSNGQVFPGMQQYSDYGIPANGQAHLGTAYAPSFGVGPPPSTAPRPAARARPHPGRLANGGSLPQAHQVRQQHPGYGILPLPTAPARSRASNHQEPPAKKRRCTDSNNVTTAAPAPLPQAANPQAHHPAALANGSSSAPAPRRRRGRPPGVRDIRKNGARGPHAHSGPTRSPGPHTRTPVDNTRVPEPRRLSSSPAAAPVVDAPAASPQPTQPAAATPGPHPEPQATAEVDDDSWMRMVDWDGGG
ncbi:hypothetical protein Q9189_002862 [Teloschistes chrysophthalmus]